MNVCFDADPPVRALTILRTTPYGTNQPSAWFKPAEVGRNVGLWGSSIRVPAASNFRVCADVLPYHLGGCWLP